MGTFQTLTVTYIFSTFLSIFLYFQSMMSYTCLQEKIGWVNKRPLLLFYVNSRYIWFVWNEHTRTHEITSPQGNAISPPSRVSSLTKRPQINWSLWLTRLWLSPTYPTSLWHWVCSLAWFSRGWRVEDRGLWMRELQMKEHPSYEPNGTYLLPELGERMWELPWPGPGQGEPCILMGSWPVKKET